MEIIQEKCKPDIHKEQLDDLVYRLYGLKVIEFKSYDSYEDICLLLTVDTSRCSNAHIDHVMPKYVLKILNNVTSRDTQFVDAQHQIIGHLCSAGLINQHAVPTTHGKLWSMERFVYDDNNNDNKDDHKMHLVELKTFAPGVCLADVTITRDLLFQLGKYIAKMRIALEDFQNDVFERVTSLWSVERFPDLKNYTFAIQNEEHRNLLENIIDYLDTNLLRKLQELPQGVMHHDFNTDNILVKERQGQDGLPKTEREMEISEVIDFFDVRCTAHVVDLAIAMSYALVDTPAEDQLDAPGYLLAGYNTMVNLSASEYDVIVMLILCRMTQSLTNAYYTAIQQPENAYVLKLTGRSWSVLKKLWSTPERELLDRWLAIAASSGTINKT